MPELPLFNSRKRQRTEPRALHPDETLQHQLKRPKVHPTTGSQPSSAFWDGLSKTWLTKGALRELNRRNNQAVSSQPRSPYRRARRFVTENFFAQLQKSRPIVQSASEFLRHCEPGTIENIKRFARIGGPDLSDLKGVSITRCPPTLF